MRKLISRLTGKTVTSDTPPPESPPIIAPRNSSGCAYPEAKPGTELQSFLNRWSSTDYRPNRSWARDIADRLVHIAKDPMNEPLVLPMFEYGLASERFIEAMLDGYAMGYEAAGYWTRSSHLPDEYFDGDEWCKVSEIAAYVAFSRGVFYDPQQVSSVAVSYSRVVGAHVAQRMAVRRVREMSNRTANVCVVTGRCTHFMAGARGGMPRDMLASYGGLYGSPKGNNRPWDIIPFVAFPELIIEPEINPTDVPNQEGQSFSLSTLASPMVVDFHARSVGEHVAGFDSIPMWYHPVPMKRDIKTIFVPDLVHSVEIERAVAQPEVRRLIDQITEARKLY